MRRTIDLPAVIPSKRGVVNHTLAQDELASK
jgi:hypothetical protein